MFPEIIRRVVAYKIFKIYYFPLPQGKYRKWHQEISDRGSSGAREAKGYVPIKKKKRSVAAQPDFLTPEQAAESKASSAVLILYASIAVSSAQIAAWQTMIHRNFWLHLSNIPATNRTDLLEASICLDGLFSPHFHEMVDDMKSASEGAENIWRHVAWAWPQRSSGHWRDLCDQRDHCQWQRRPMVATLRWPPHGGCPAVAATAVSHPTAAPPPLPLPSQALFMLT